MPHLHGPLASFRSTTFVDCEYRSVNGNRPELVCIVTVDYETGRASRYWKTDLQSMTSCPFPTGPKDLMVSYFASAELGCLLQLGWPLPTNVLDLFAEHRVETNGLYLPTGNGLVGALALRGLPHMESAAKNTVRGKIINQASWTSTEEQEILDYCEDDTKGLRPLLDAMLPSLDLPRALLRGRYTKAIARMEHAGIPIDTRLQRDLTIRWGVSRLGLVRSMDENYCLYDGLTFKKGRFSEFLRVNGIPWPRSESGTLKLDDETFKEQARIWPILSPVRELRQALDRMYVPDLQVGSDGRCRTLLSPFASKTGRNQPSAKRFVFNFANWQRGIVRPPEGWGLSYIDFSSQEICIAAGLSGDECLIEAYGAGDPYLSFAKQAGLVPKDATRTTHSNIRDICKTVFLGVNYGLGVERMAQQAGIAPALATELISRHKATYPRYWKWSERVVTSALLSGEMSSIFGWRRKITSLDRPTSLMNFPMQANGAEMMRLAAIAATEAGIEVCAPIHDAFLIAAPLSELDEKTAEMCTVMSQAGRAVTGILVRTDAKTIRYPERYMDERGINMWNRVVKQIGRPDAAYTPSQ